MAKKNWIFIKRGLSEDPKHREAMHEAVWLFMHICDAADWEKGIVYDWRDKEIAADMSLSTATVRGWRNRLSELGYITCQQRQHCLDIIIHNWTNPRDYGGKKTNVRQGDITMSPSKEEKIEGVPQGVPQDDTQALDELAVNDTLFIESSSLSESSSHTRALSKEKTDEANQMIDAILESNEKAKSSWPGREKIPEPIRDLLDVYVQLTGQRPVKDQLMDWLGAGNDWMEAGICVDDLRKAYEKSKPDQYGKGGFLVNRPGSLTRTAQMFAGQRHTSHAGMSPLNKALAELQEMTR